MMSVSAILLTPASLHAEFNEAEKEALHELIQDYIKANPEVVRDALIALANEEAIAQREQAFRLLGNDNGDPYIGAGADADIIIYEFSDYNCGYCKRVFAQLQAVLADDPKVRLTLKEYPILAESSLEAAKAAIAAHKQGLFEPFHIGLMNWRGALSTNAILSIAAEAGLDLDQLETDMKHPVVEEILNRTRMTARALEVSGTPALLMGGVGSLE